MKRPSVTQEIIESAAKETASRCDGLRNDERLLLGEAIASCYKHPMNGRRLAKALEDELHWDVELLDPDDLSLMVQLVRERHQMLCLSWVKTNGIKPEFPPGTRVLCKTRRVVGTIQGIADESAPACYIVNPTNHKSEGSSNTPLIVRFEDAVYFPGESTEERIS